MWRPLNIAYACMHTYVYTHIHACMHVIHMMTFTCKHMKLVGYMGMHACMMPRPHILHVITSQMHIDMQRVHSNFTS